MGSSLTSSTTGSVPTSSDTFAGDTLKVSRRDARLVTDIGWIVTYQGQSGGNWVRETVQDGLTPEFHFENVMIDSGLGPRRFPRSVRQLATYDDQDTDLWVETIGSLALRLPDRRRPNVLALHHFERPNPYGSIPDAVTAIKNTLALRRMGGADRIVVVSDFWASHLADRGITDNVRTVYNGLPVEQFAFDSDAVEATRAELAPTDQPLIHVGPCAPGKGGDAVYRELSDMEATLITTGRKVHDTPVEHYNPPYEEYLRILAACDVVVAMSDSLEGWNLQVQEAMLCRTPVVGSGRGGMGMLLEEGGQIVCESLSDLEDSVRAALADSAELGAQGREYASQFTRERMLEGWRNVFEEVP